MSWTRPRERRTQHQPGLRDQRHPAVTENLARATPSRASAKASTTGLSYSDVLTGSHPTPATDRDQQ